LLLSDNILVLLFLLMLIDYFNVYARACSFSIADQLKSWENLRCY
jgi:hypothetical protein